MLGESVYQYEKWEKGGGERPRLKLGRGKEEAFWKHLLSTDYVPDTTLGSVNMKKMKNQPLLFQSYGLFNYGSMKQVCYDCKR